MSFFDHLDELRSRLMKCLVVFVAGFLAAYGLVNEWVMEFLRAPVFAVLPADKHHLYFTNLFENFMTHLKIAGYSSLFLGSPFFFYQLWAFIAPGLYPRERKLVVPFVTAATLCFVGGAAFAYYVVFPAAFQFFVTFGFDTDVPLLTIEAYYSTVLKLLLLFGLAFELPVLITLLGALGVIDAPMMRKNRRFAIIGITVACAMFAPPDAISMLMMMAPLILLYEASIYVVQWMGVKREDRVRAMREQDSDETGLAPADGDSDEGRAEPAVTTAESSPDEELGPLDGRSR